MQNYYDKENITLILNKNIPAKEVSRRTGITINTIRLFRSRFSRGVLSTKYNDIIEEILFERKNKIQDIQETLEEPDENLLEVQGTIQPSGEAPIIFDTNIEINFRGIPILFDTPPNSLRIINGKLFID